MRFMMAGKRIQFIKRMGHKSPKENVALLRAQLEANELKHRVNELETIVKALEAELKESNALLLKSRNLAKRPFTSSIEKQIIAAKHNWCCATGETCPMRKLTPNGTFSESLFIIYNGSESCLRREATLSFFTEIAIHGGVKTSMARILSWRRRWREGSQNTAMLR